MPLRTSSGTCWGASSLIFAGSSRRTRLLAGPLAAAAPAATAPAAPARYASVHHGVRGEGGGARGDGGEVGDQTPRLGPAALGALRRIVGSAHRAHQIEPLLAIGALVLVESHRSHLSVK